ncbi:integrase, catalytic region, zinc finger, CCHC-type containing protein [Tanacetum coccineum]
MLSSTGVKPSTSASGPQPSGKTKKDRIMQTQSSTQKNKVEVHPRKLNANFPKLNVLSVIVCICSDNHDLCVLDYINNVNARAKSKSTKKQRKRKVWKPTGKMFTTIGYIWRPTGPSKLSSGTVKFGNDHVAKILGYGDYQIGNVTIPGLQFGKEFRHNLFSVGQFCDSNLEVAFRQHTCFIRNLEGVDLLTGSRGNNLYTMSLGDMKVSSPICLVSKASKTKSWLWHRRLSYLNFGTVNHLARHGLVQGLPKLKFEKDHPVFCMCHGLIIETIHVDFDELTAMAFEHSSSGLALHDVTPVTISSGLVPNPPPLTPFVPPLRTDWDMLFQLLFDELLNPPPSVDHSATEVVAPIDEVAAPVPAISTGSPSSTTVDQDAPSPIAHMGNDPYFGVPIPEDHPLENIIGELARPVSTRLQLHEQALFCYCDAFLTAVEPKTYKDALTQACWIEAMQEELNELSRTS